MTPSAFMPLIISLWELGQLSFNDRKKRTSRLHQPHRAPLVRSALLLYLFGNKRMSRQCTAGSAWIKQMPSATRTNVRCSSFSSCILSPGLLIPCILCILGGTAPPSRLGAGGARVDVVGLGSQWTAVLIRLASSHSLHRFSPARPIPISSACTEYVCAYVDNVQSTRLQQGTWLALVGSTWRLSTPSNLSQTETMVTFYVCETREVFTLYVCTLGSYIRYLGLIIRYLPLPPSSRRRYPRKWTSERDPRGAVHGSPLLPQPSVSAVCQALAQPRHCSQ